ncbi:MAG: Smr/MutS family protein [Bacteroidota bacterium]
MKLIHPHTYEKLGFDIILQRTEKYVSGPEAKERCQSLSPTSDPDILIPELRRVAEAKNIWEFEDHFPGAYYMAIEPILQKLQVEGDYLSARQLSQFLAWLKGIKTLRGFLEKKKEIYPLLASLAYELPFSERMIPMIGAILDDHGNISDKASPELARIRKQIISSGESLRDTLNRVLRWAHEKGWAQDREATIRNDRLVIPVRADSRGRVPGFVHDISQSGNTVYVEPTEALNLNNQLRELQIQEHNEVVRILREVTAKLREFAPEIEGFQEVMIRLELIMAKAKVALDLNATLPTVNPAGQKIMLRDAYYPLLQLKALEEKMTVVPLNLTLDPGRRIVVISGPNAGGKSVSLKVVGLLQIMLQTGFLLPVDEGSEFRLFDALYMDIGDEQSIESDLSTYTSRLYQWRQMGDNMNRNSLFLVDEFGSGTDPTQGGAIAESFLERFVNQRAFGIITTHYGNLKDYAEVTSGVINAAMQFDTQELKPTYFLMEGVPGRSYAFEMARRVGVHQTILKKARRKVGVDEIETDKLLKELEKKSQQLNKLVAENKRKENKLQQLVEKNERRERDLDAQRKHIIRDAKEEAKNLILQANRKIETTIREIRETQAEKERTRKLRKELMNATPEVEPLEALPELPEKKKKKRVTQSESSGVEVLAGAEIVAGDWVKLKNATSYGQLVDIQGKKGVIETEGLRVNVKLNQLVKIRPPKRQKVSAPRVAVITQDDHESEIPMTNAKLEMDVMGMRVEKALTAVDKFLDEARVAGLKRVRVLHGKGTGALRQAIRDHLAMFSFVNRTADAPVEDGGAGWTVIDLD